MTSRSHTVPVVGGELVVDRLGSEREDAPVALAVHGISANSRIWLAPAAALGDRVTLLAPDLRGRARSAQVGPPYGLDVHVDDMVAVLDAAGLERAVVTGHSMGAYVACRLALRHPDRVARLVLVDGGLEIPGSRGADPQAFLEAFAGATVAKLRDEYPDEIAFRSSWLSHPGAAGTDIDPAILEALADRDRTGTDPHLRSSLRADAVWADAADIFAADDAEQIGTEAVLLHAEHGMSDNAPPMHPDAIAQGWAQQTPDRRAVRVPGANHLSVIAGARGAKLVAGEIAAAVDPLDGGPSLA